MCCIIKEGSVEIGRRNSDLSVPHKISGTLSCYNKVLWSEWPLNSRNSFLKFWRLEVQDQVLNGESPLLGSRLPSSQYMLTWQKKRKRNLWSPFYKGINPIHEGSTLMTYSSPKGADCIRRYHLLIPLH